MIILLLFLQKQNLAFAVYLFGSVLSSKRLFRPSKQSTTPHTTPFFLPPEDPFPVLLLPNSIPE